MGSRFSCGVVVALLLSIGVASPASAEHGQMTESVRASLLSQALNTATQDGDAHPYDITAVATSAVGAVHLTPTATAPMCESSPSCAGAPAYVVAMRGQFTCGTCSHPPRMSVAPGTVITLTFDAASMFETSFGLGSSYPKLEQAGVPVRLGPAPLTSAQLLSIARSLARASGDAHPRDILVASGSASLAATMFDPGGPAHAPPAEPGEPQAYVITMRGRFHQPVGPPPGAHVKLRPLPVLEVSVNEAGELGGLSVERRVPKPLARLGAVARLG